MTGDAELMSPQTMTTTLKNEEKKIKESNEKYGKKTKVQIPCHEHNGGISNDAHGRK